MKLSPTETTPRIPGEIEDYQIVEAVVQSCACVTDLLEDKRTTIDRLRKLLFGSGSEKTRDVVPQTPAAPPSAAPPGTEPLKSAASEIGGGEQAEPLQAEATSPPGHGRNGAERYMEGLALQQTGEVGDITAGLPPADYISGTTTPTSSFRYG